MMREAWSGVDVYLKKRYDLIPNLVDTAKAYMVYEQQLLEKITTLRASAIQARSVDQKISPETELKGALSQLLVAAENYPALKASTIFLDFQQQLSSIEGEIEMSRRYYNGTVREYNIAIESFPANLLARMFNFSTALYFENANSQEREPVKLNF